MHSTKDTEPRALTGCNGGQDLLAPVEQVRVPRLVPPAVVLWTGTGDTDAVR